jgi:hypothetical protein
MGVLSDARPASTLTKILMNKLVLPLWLAKSATCIKTAVVNATAAIERTLSVVQSTAASGISSLFTEGLTALRQMIKPVVHTTVLAGVILASSSGPPAMAQPAKDVGEIAPRPDSAQVESALSTLQSVQAEIPKHCANLAAQADPLSSAISAYKADPSAENVLGLLRQEAVIAGVGSTGCDKIAVEASRAAAICKDLAASCASDAAALLPDIEGAKARTDAF